MAGPFHHVGRLDSVRDARYRSGHRRFETFLSLISRVFRFEMNNLEDAFLTQDPVFGEAIRVEEFVQQKLEITRSRSFKLYDRSVLNNLGRLSRP